MSKKEYNELLGILIAWSMIVIGLNMVVCWAWQLGPYAVR